MAGPYYTGSGAGFLTDYSGAAAAGSAFQGFADAYQTAQDRQMKRIEQQAQLDALKTKTERDKQGEKLDLYKAQLMQNPDTGDFQERELTQREQIGEGTKLFGEGGMIDPNDPTGTHVVVNKNAPKYISAQNSGLRGQATMGRLEETRNQNAAKAGHDIDEDSVMKDMATARYSLSRGKSLLDGKMPLTYNNLNAVQQDVINGMTKGGQSSEGKVSREMQESWIGNWNNLMAKAGKYGPDNDIRVKDPGLYKQIQGLLHEVDSTVGQNMADRVDKLSGNYSQSTNKKTQNVVKLKRQQYAAPPASDGLVPTGMVNQGMVQGQGAGPADTVQMLDPNGNIRAVPRDQVEAAKQAGGVPL